MPQMLYACTELDQAFRQSEIISGIAQYFFNVEENVIDYEVIDWAVIVSQDCDLIQDYAKRQDGKPGGLNGIMLYEAKTLAAMKAAKMTGREFEKVERDENDRYHFLPAAGAEMDVTGEGTPDLIVDFKRYFTISTKDLHWQILKNGGPKRRARLISPYLEHLQKRAMSYMSRVALPEPRTASVAFAQVAIPVPAIER